jgi:hypothetical protein
MFQNQPYSQDVFWEILSKREMSLVDLMYDLGDDQDATPEWYATRNQILDWLLSPQNRGRIARLWQIPPRVLREDLVEFAARYGFASFLQELLRRGLDPTVIHNSAIRHASDNGHAPVVRLLLADPRVDPAALTNWAIKGASFKGHAEVVRALLADPRVNPGASNNEAIQMASKYGHAEVVRALLADPRVNPTAENNDAITYAIRWNHAEVMRALLADPRVRATFSKQDAEFYLYPMRYRTPEVYRLLQDYIREKQRGQPLDDDSEPPAKMIKNPLIGSLLLK